MAEVNQGFEAAMRRGREFGAAGTWDKALQEFVRAVQLAPSDISARYGLAHSLVKTNQPDYALQQLQGIVRLQPQNTEALHLLGQVHQHSGRPAEAVQTYGRLKEIYNKAGQTPKVAETLREIIRTDPTQIGAYRELMDLAKAKGDRKGAAQVAVGLGRFYQGQNRPKDALSAANEALMLQPGLPEAESLKAAVSSVTTPTSAPSFDPMALPPLPGEDGLSVNPAQANPEAEAASKKDQTINGLIKSAEENLARGETGLALRNYELAVESGAERADIFYSLGNLYAEQGQLDQAVSYLRRSTNDPDYAASAFFTMGQLYANADRLDEAANAYQDALNLIDLQTIGKDEVDELVDMYDALGDVLLRQSKNQEALEHYNRLVNFINSRNLRTEKSNLMLVNVRELAENLKASGNLGLATAPAPATASANGLNYATNDEEDDELTSSIRFGSDEGESENPVLAEVRTGTATALQPIGAFAGASNGAKPTAIATAPGIPGRFPAKLVKMEPFTPAQPYVRAAQEFMESHRYSAAVDACQEMIHYYPEYIPAQAILSEIFVAQDRLEPARLKYQFVVDLYQLRQEPEKSLECYKRLGEISPDNMGLRIKLANMLMQYGQNEEAAEISLTTISNYVRSGQLERALEECQKLRKLAPQSASIRVQYAELLGRLDRYGEALPELRRALELDPNNLKALSLLNIASFLLNDTNLKWSSFQTVVERSRQDETTRRQLIEEYRQAVSINANPGLYYALGCLYLENKQTKTADRTFGQSLDAVATATSPDRTVYEPLIHWTLGSLYLDQGRADDAVEELSKAAASADKADPALYAPSGAAYGTLPGQVPLYRKIAQAFGMQGQPGQAIKALKAIKKLMPFNREIHTELAGLYFNQGQLTEALGELGELVAHYEETAKVEPMIEVLKEMTDLAPNNIGVRDKLSEVYLKRGMIEAGLKELDELAELQRKNGRLKDAVRTLQKAAETYGMMGKLEAVYEIYDRIVRISPGDVEARQQLVNRHLMSGRLTEAIEEQRTIAQICLQANNTQGAIAALHQVIGLAPEDIKAYFQLAGVLSSTNEHFQAYRLYQRVLRLDPGNEKAKPLQDQAYKRASEAGQLPSVNT